MKPITKTQTILLWAGGYDKETAELCTSPEIKKMTVAGAMVFIPAFIALFSYSYGFFFIFENITGALFGGIAASIVLFFIDRSVMAYGRPGKWSFGMLGRVLLAITVGFLLAEPLILKVFEDSIVETQLTELEDVKREKAKLYDTRIDALNKENTASTNHLNQLQQAYTSEMDGTGGSGIRNQGPIYQQKHNDYLAYQKQDSILRANNLALTNGIENEKSMALTTLEKNQAKGLIGRMRSLNKLADKEPIVGITSWLLRIFFCLIELLPLLIKISPSGDRGLYYKLVDANDLEREQVHEMSSKERLQLKSQEEKLRLTQAFNEICCKEIQSFLTAKEKDSNYLMMKALEMSERKIDIAGKAIKSIKDETLLNETLTVLENIHAGFMQTVEQLLSKSNTNFSTSKS